MASIRDISIKNKLVLMQVFTSVLVLGLCFGVFVISDIKNYKERKVNSTLSIAQVIGKTSISAIQFMDNDAAREMLFDLQKVEPDVINASIIDTKGKPFAHYTRAGKVAILFAPPFRDNDRFEGRYLYVYKNIWKNRELLGTVCLQVELTELREIKEQKIQIAIILLIVGIGLSFLIAFINQRYISMPILTLVNVIKQIKNSNDYHRHVEVTGKDEISTLSSEFNNLMDEIARSNRKKDEFIGIASHELKTPLTSVKLYLETLAGMPIEAPAKTFILKARDGVNKLQNLIVDLLDVSKIQSGQLQLELKEIAIDQLVDECILDAQMNTATHTIIKQGRPTSCMVRADKDRIEQVIINLISNAIKYSGEDKNIIVQTFDLDTEVKVSIRDYGIGIAGADQQKIFDRFYRAKGNNHVVSGFGLGLYICSQIIKRHSGAIGVTSREQEGSTFYFTLPCVGRENKGGKKSEDLVRP